MLPRCVRAGFLILLASLSAPPALFPQSTGESAAETSGGLVDLLRSSDPKIRARAARDIGKSADVAAVPALAGALGDPDAKVRRETVIALSQFRVPNSLDALLKATRDMDPDVRVLAVRGVVGYYTGVTPSAGFTGFVKREYSRAKSHFVQENTRIDPGVIVDPQAVTALVATMTDARFREAAQEAAKALGILVAQAAVPALVKSAHAPDERLAREALNALQKIKDKSAGPQLMDLLDSPDKNIKRDAAVTIGILRNRDAVPRLQTMFENDPDQKNKESALEGLAYIGDPVSVPLFTQALWRADKSLRTSAAEGLARARDPKALSELQKAVGVEKDARARLADEFALSALGRDDYLAAIVHELGSKLYGDIAGAYLVELSRDEKFLPKLYPFLSEQDSNVRRKLCTVLMFSGNQGSLEHLERLSHDPNGEVASEALRAARAVRLRASASAPKSEGRI